MHLIKSFLLLSMIPNNYQLLGQTDSPKQENIDSSIVMPWDKPRFGLAFIEGYNGLLVQYGDKRGNYPTKPENYIKRYIYEIDNIKGTGLELKKILTEFEASHKKGDKIKYKYADGTVINNIDGTWSFRPINEFASIGTLELKTFVADSEESACQLYLLNKAQKEAEEFNSNKIEFIKLWNGKGLWSYNPTLGFIGWDKSTEKETYTSPKNYLKAKISDIELHVKPNNYDELKIDSYYIWTFTFEDGSTWVAKEIDSNKRENFFLSFLMVDPIPLKWPKPIKNAIRNGKVLIGMTREQAELSWGKPSNINQTITAHGRSEQWCYRNNYLYFDNGHLVNIQSSY